MPTSTITPIAAPLTTIRRSARAIDRRKAGFPRRALRRRTAAKLIPPKTLSGKPIVPDFSLQHGKNAGIRSCSAAVIGWDKGID
ncbi:hypothetical protein [Streptomyces sp. CBMA29]|uniref:hypothetical protein n=1 Tax=Streptomyces sp. CBMA29 TaxID=1896314 RepID=UPI001661A67E|nr:hypothetical protein [Streptomyces sp. CBMA29]